ncbi:ATP-dependent RNA helicase [Emydomyces testavorans]|uniref:RNA helicase n=1 Tax=Emydomyces testavorans TaxID=2070801 RepID=A0AAF0IKI4_9EURO|nr:ATP-dependent RNA helicase [Emydomyces testavorans]
MAPNRKKKKPASNPARGFTTVSIPSKSKAESTETTIEAGDMSIETPAQGYQKATSATQPKDMPDSKVDLAKLSPEELEKHFEDAELQSFLDKFAEKCKNEASRQVGKLETERRTLRAQGVTLSIREWLTPDIYALILEKEMKEIRKLTSYFNKLEGNVDSMTNEEDMCMNMWTLRQTLLKLGFRDSRVDEGLREILLHCSYDQASTKDFAWILNQAFERLALHCAEDELPAYEQPKTAPILVDQTDDRGSITPSFGNSTKAREPDKPIPPCLPSHPESEASDTDLNPESLVPRYVELQSRIYSLRPSFFNQTKTTCKKEKSNITQDSMTDIDIEKLKRKLALVEKDVLFDSDEAAEKWKEKLSELRAETSESLRREFEVGGRMPELVLDEDEKTLAKSKPVDAAPALGLFESDSDEGGMLGSMFPSESDSPATTATSALGDRNTTIKTRDFGKSSGIHPRRILEEACRARDSGFKLYYRDLSSTPFSHRKSVEITWSKVQEITPDSPLPDIVYSSNSHSMSASMASVGAATRQQAESYISVVALFLMASSSRENKVSMKLPGVWRDVWEELSSVKKEYSDAADREIVKNLKQLLQQVKSQADEDIVLIENFKRRNGNGRPAAEESFQRKPYNGGPLSHYLQSLWRDRSSTMAFKQMMATRRVLPIWPFKEQIMEMVANNQALIICSETGSGKSTQIPSFILENELIAGRPCKIYVTEPRRISAISLAKRVSEELGETKDAVGTNRSLVGYAIRLESKITASTKLIYATTGVVIRMLERPQDFRDISHLVLDEVHERTLDSDFLLITLRRLLHQRADLKLILMSATVDAKRFSTYLDHAPVLDIPGRTYPVKTSYLEDAIEITRHCSHEKEPLDYTDDSDSSNTERTQNDEGLRSTLSEYSKQTRDAVCAFDAYRLDYKLIIDLISAISTKPELEPYSKAFLIFIPGLAEIRKLQDSILSEPFFGDGWILYSLHSSIASEDQEKAFLVPPKGVRKIVIATNIAETGVTIPDITAVIDTGKEKVMRFDERRQISRLVETFISRANAKQRRGRAGRVQEGLCFHLFTKHRHDKMLAEQQTPEMLRLSLQDLILRVKICNMGDIEETLSEALDPPSSKNVRRAIEALKAVKALTGAEALTPLGRQLAQLPLDVFLGKLILYGTFFKCVDASVSIAAILSCKSPFVHTSASSNQTQAAKRAFDRGNSDLLSVYNAYCAWKRCRNTPGMNESTFCRKNCLSPQALLNIEDVKTQLLVSLVDTGLLKLNASEEAVLNRTRFTGRRRQFFAVPERLDINSSNDLVVNAAIAWSFYPRLLTRQGKGWRNISNNQSVVLHSTSVNRNADFATKWLSYYHIMQSRTRNYNAHGTSAVEDFCIALLCGDAEFKMYSGVVSIDGSRMRFSVKDWKSMIVLKALSTRVRDILSQTFRNPKKELTTDQREWLDILQQVFVQQKLRRDEKNQRE